MVGEAPVEPQRIMTSDTETYKRQAAEYAVQYVQSGMVIGLGHGRTAQYAVRRIAALVLLGELRDVLAVPCSQEVEKEARALGIHLTSLEEHQQLDLTIDGADEVSPQLDLIKGGGGAMLREKIVAQATRREVIVVDDGKLSPQLGTRAPVPVEVEAFGWRTQAAYLERLGARWTVRNDGEMPVLSDNGKIILDADFGPIADLPRLAAQLQARAGIVAHGIFIGLATEVVVAGPEGIRVLTAGGGG